MRRAGARAVGQALAQILGHDVQLVRDGDGAPRLIGSGLQISLSHSDGLTAIAVYAQPVGIDITPVSAHWLDAAVASDLFSGAENAWLSRLALADKPLGFSILWTLKEAAMKRDRACLDRADPPLLDPFLNHLTPVVAAKSQRLAPISGANAAVAIIGGRQQRIALAIAN